MVREDDLKKLPLRGIVAYAVRAARRVQPLLDQVSDIMTDFENHRRGIEHAIYQAERFCMGHNAEASAAGLAYAAFNGDSDLLRVYQSRGGAFAVTSAADAAFAAGTAADHATYVADGNAYSAHVAALVASDAARAADDAHLAIAASAEQTDADYRLLLQLNLGTYPELGKPIDPTEKGDDTQTEEITLKNKGSTPLSITGWTLVDRSGLQWQLSGSINAGQSKVLRRNGMAMTLNNGGDEITLFDAAHVQRDKFQYDSSIEGTVIQTDH
jgi:hypothetical protein